MDDVTREFMDRDPFGSRLGVELIELEEGRAKVRLELDDSHLNFMGMVHGAVIFAVADLAFAAAANSWGKRSMAIHVSIDFLKAPGDTPYLEGEATYSGRAGRAAHFLLEVRNSLGDIMAVCHAWAYGTDRPLVSDMEDPERTAGG